MIIDKDRTMVNDDIIDNWEFNLPCMRELMREVIPLAKDQLSAIIQDKYGTVGLSKLYEVACVSTIMEVSPIKSIRFSLMENYERTLND